VSKIGQASPRPVAHSTAARAQGGTGGEALPRYLIADFVWNFCAFNGHTTLGHLEKWRVWHEARAVGRSARATLGLGALVFGDFLSPTWADFPLGAISRRIAALTTVTSVPPP
jgi:hypothetical protein